MVENFLNKFKSRLEILIPKNDFYPDRNFSIKLASEIDRHKFLREVFLLFKKIYSKPLLRS
jgi:hypothetical protein